MQLRTDWLSHTCTLVAEPSWTSNLTSGWYAANRFSMQVVLPCPLSPATILQAAQPLSTYAHQTKPHKSRGLCAHRLTKMS